MKTDGGGVEKIIFGPNWERVGVMGIIYNAVLFCIAGSLGLVAGYPLDTTKVWTVAAAIFIKDLVSVRMSLSVYKHLWYYDVNNKLRCNISNIKNGYVLNHTLEQVLFYTFQWKDLHFLFVVDVSRYNYRHVSS